MKSTFTLFLGLLCSVNLWSQDPLRPMVLKTTLLTHAPVLDGSARVGLEIPIQNTPWSLEPMVGWRYGEYLLGRDLRFSPDLRFAAYQYKPHWNKPVVVRSGFALQYRLLHSDETQTVCTQTGTTGGWLSFETCTASFLNDYRRMEHHMQLGYLYGRRYSWGRMQVDLDFIVGLQIIAVDRIGYISGMEPPTLIDLSYDIVEDGEGVGLLPWMAIDLKFGLPLSRGK